MPRPSMPKITFTSIQVNPFQSAVSEIKKIWHNDFQDNGAFELEILTTFLLNVQKKGFI